MAPNHSRHLDIVNYISLCGAPDWTRTSKLRFLRPLPIPIRLQELKAHNGCPGRYQLAYYSDSQVLSIVDRLIGLIDYLPRGLFCFFKRSQYSQWFHLFKERFECVEILATYPFVVENVWCFHHVTLFNPNKKAHISGLQTVQHCCPIRFSN